MTKKNLPPETKIEHYSLIQLGKPEGGLSTAILRLETTAYKSESMQIYTYDGPNGSKDVTGEVPPNVVGRLVGETVTHLLRSGVWSIPSTSDGGPEEGMPF